MVRAVSIRMGAVLMVSALFLASAQQSFAAVAYGAIGTTATGSTSLSIAYPTGITAGQLLVMTIVNKYPTDAPSVPSGWTVVPSGRGRGGETTAGTDRGEVYMTVFVRVADGTESGNVSVTITSGNCAIGAITRYTKTSSAWIVAATYGNDGITGNTSWSVTGAANPGLTSGDMVIAASAINTDNYAYSSQSMTATNATLGSHTERLDTGPAIGGHCHMVLSTHAVSSGTATAAPVFTMTSGNYSTVAPMGSTVFLRIRESANPAAGDLTITTPATVTGDLSVLGTLAKGSGSFVIDHPLDPKNKLLYHSFVESPDVKNLYDGVAILDEEGEALVELPSYFLALNRDYRYLATPIGEGMPDLHLTQEVRKRWFGLWGTPVLRIAGGKPDGKVSWQVTGIRKDPFILNNPIIPEVEKGPNQPVDKGEFVCPECYAN